MLQFVGLLQSGRRRPVPVERAHAVGDDDGIVSTVRSSLGNAVRARIEAELSYDGTLVAGRTVS